MRWHPALLAALAACASHPTPRNVKEVDAGISIALYARADSSFAVVDDRRWLDVSGRSIMLANIDPGAALASLVIEPADRALRIGACVRERLPDPAPREPPAQERRTLLLRRLGAPPPPAPPPRVVDEISARFAPAVRCEVAARPGRYLVRIVYVTTRLGYRAQHEVDVGASTAKVTSRFAIVTPSWRERAELVLYDGAPGGERTPIEVARGQVTLDGSTAVLATPVREVASQIRRVYDGAIITSEDSTDVTWASSSVTAVWVWLELATLRLAPGPVHVHVDLDGPRDLDVPATARKQAEGDAPLRLPLWVDDGLRGSRQRIIELNDSGAITERFILGVANLGETPREVWIEEHMRAATKRKVDRAWPKKPTAAGDVLRNKVEARPGRIERIGYTLAYEL